MCEPYHSIVQYPNDSDDDLTGQSHIKSAIHKLGEWGKNIGKWFHISKMGCGHSEAIGKVNSASAWQLWDFLTNYECLWWNRTVRLDGHYHGNFVDKIDAFSSAEEYAKKVCIGNLTLLRHFLETSIKKSNNPMLYLKQFQCYFLNHRGKQNIERKLKIMSTKGIQKDSITKLLLGYTRRRGLIVPEWADDTQLWK